MDHLDRIRAIAMCRNCHLLSGDIWFICDLHVHEEVGEVVSSSVTKSQASNVLRRILARFN